MDNLLDGDIVIDEDDYEIMMHTLGNSFDINISEAYHNKRGIEITIYYADSVKHLCTLYFRDAADVMRFLRYIAYFTAQIAKKQNIDMGDKLEIPLKRTNEVWRIPGFDK